MSELKTHIEIEVKVDYDFQPEEPATLEYPGTRADVEINSVTVYGANIKRHLTESQLDAIWHECFEAATQEPQER